MANEGTVIGWGKPSLYATIGEGGAWKRLPDAVENSVELTTTKGDKMEAKVEGGEPEAVKYKKNTWELAYKTRVASDNGTPRKKPFSDNDGIIKEEPSIAVVPEDQKAPGLYIKRAHLSLENAFTSEEGGIWSYIMEPMKNADGTKMLVVGVLTMDETTGLPKSIAPVQAETESEAPAAIEL